MTTAGSSPSTMTTRATFAVLAAAMSGLYLISKISYAAQGRLGVTGGPDVSADSYDSYGPGEVTQAQFANAGTGLIIGLVALLSLLPAIRRLNRWIVTTVLAAVSVLLAVMTALFLGRALATDDGGLLFGVFCLIWCGLYTALTITTAQSLKPERSSQGNPTRTSSA
jgi:hypothetical protein